MNNYTMQSRRLPARFPLATRMGRRCAWGLLRGASRCLVSVGYMVSALGFCAWALGADVGHGVTVGSLGLAVGLQCAWGWGLFHD